MPHVRKAPVHHVRMQADPTRQMLGGNLKYNFISLAPTMPKYVTSCAACRARACVCVFVRTCVFVCQRVSTFLLFFLALCFV
jgi:hypothetical protein